MAMRQSTGCGARAGSVGRTRLAALVAVTVAGVGSGVLSAQTFPYRGQAVHPAGLVPESLAIGDFNADGLPDVAVANTRAYQPAGFSNENVSVLLSSGAGDLLPPVEYPVGDRPEGIASGDFDNNGTIDLATANFQGNSVSILLGNEGAIAGQGDGTFTPISAVPVPGGPRDVIAVDLDGDGHVDLLTANYNADSVSVLAGSGDGSFTVANTINVDRGPEVIATGFFDDNALLDIVTCNAIGDNLSILRGDGDFAVSPLATVAVGDNPRYVEVLDLDGDGLDELIAANHLSHTVTVIANQGGVSFPIQATLSTSAMRSPIWIDSGDLDADGFTDLVVAYASTDSIVIYSGGPGMTFGAGEVLPAGRNVVGVEVVDLDADSLPDLVVSNAIDYNLYVYFGSLAPGAVVIDDGDTGTSATGTWSPSGGTDPYGGGSVYAKVDGGASYRWTSALSSARYRVFAWWSFVGSRSTQAPYTVEHAGTPTTISVNQRRDSGRWNGLGQYVFAGTGTVQVSSTSSSESTCADAVCFVPLLTDTEAPTISAPSIAPNPAILGDAITFSATGSDSDGTILRYEWQSDLDGILGHEASFTMSTLSVGTHTISVRAQDNLGFWSAVATAELTVSDVPVGGYTYIIDNGQVPGTTSTGSWSVSSGPSPYGVNSLYARNGATYTYSFQLGSAGTYDVYAWWTQWSSRSTSVPYDIAHTAGVTTVPVNQQQGGGTWNYLGTFSFGTTAAVTIRALGSSTTCADAVALDLATATGSPPTATIVEISPNPAELGAEVSFSGSGDDTDGDAIVAYEWRSNLDGVRSTAPSFLDSGLSIGNHLISFRVQDETGLWSPDAQASLEVTGVGGMRILDNGDPGTSFEGTWTRSSGPNPYGASSLYARNGPTYTYSFPLSGPGTYDVFAWWTEWSSRSTAVPYDIAHIAGVTTVPRNQQQDGGKWNYLGTFSFDATARVTIRAVGSSTTCADAVAIAPGSGNVPPSAQILGVAPNPVFAGQEVTFEGTGTDPDGTVTAYEWVSSLDGSLSTDPTFTHSLLSVGQHTIELRVKDDAETWSAPATEVLVVRSDTEIILDNGDLGTSSSGGWSVSGAPNPYGPTSLYAKVSGSYTYTFSGLVPGTYRVSAWWTEWSSRSTAVQIEIQHATGTLVVPVNQRQGGGRWNPLAELSFESAAVVTIRVDGSSSSLSTCADAVRLERLP